MMQGGKHSSVGGLDVAKSTPTIRHLCTAVRQGLAFMNARQVQPSRKSSSIITSSGTAMMR